jgi:hypothetical protein
MASFNSAWNPNLSQILQQPSFWTHHKKAETLDPVVFFLGPIFATWRLRKGLANPTKGFL